MSAPPTQVVFPSTRAPAPFRPFYGPAAILAYALAQDSSEPLGTALHIERFRQRLNVHLDGNEQFDNGRSLHSHFCLTAEDRRLAFHEGLRDVRDAVCDVMQDLCISI